MAEEPETNSPEGGDRRVASGYAIVMPVFLVDEVTGRRLVAIVCRDNQSSDSWLVDEAELKGGDVECNRSGCAGSPPHTLIPLEEALDVSGFLELDEGSVVLGIADVLSGLLKLRRAEPAVGPRPVPLEAVR